ncbi:MAG: MnmC family methyltransferase [Nodosilinea sp.]
MPVSTGALVLAPTADGAMTLFSEDFGECFHSCQGAYAEAYATYVDATELASLAQAPAVALRLEATLLWGDARQHIQTLETLEFQADVIFFAPFSPPHCPELWTVEFIQQAAACLHSGGKLVTYSCAAAVRTAF